RRRSRGGDSPLRRRRGVAATIARRRLRIGRRICPRPCLRAARADAPAGREYPWRAVSRPRVLFVGRTRYRLPLQRGLQRKFDALGRELDVRVLGSAAAGSPTDDATFTLVPALRFRPLDGVLFWLGLPGRIARLLTAFRPDAVVCQTAYEGAAALLARRIARVPVRTVV